MKKKIILAVCIIFAVFLLLIAIGLVGLGIMAYRGLGVTEGRCLITANGSYMLIDESGSPIVMSNAKNKEDLFDGLSSGDEILVVHDGIEESYPAGTGVYYCKKIADGEYSDLPEQTLSSLAEMGWVESSYEGEKVSCSGDGFEFSIIIPEGWSYEKVPPTYNLPYKSTEDTEDLPDTNPREIIFWYSDDKENHISLKYETTFGVCGTGLESKEILLGGNEATMGTYDNKESWDFITFGKFDVEKGTYVALNCSDEQWYSAHGEDVMKILNTIEYK